GGPLGVAEPAGPQRVSRLALGLGMAGWVTGGLGARMALEPGHGRTAVPVRSAMAGTIVAVVAVVAAAVFGTSLLGLVSIPHRYGQNWTQKVDFVLPAGPGEIALGQRTLRTLHVSIGQQVRASVNDRATRLRVVGEVVLPAFTEGGSAATDLGDGAVVAPPLLSGPHPQTGCGHGITCYSFLLIRYGPGIRLRAADARLEAT